MNMAPKKACRLIREGVEKALRQDLKALKPVLPEHFEVELEYKDHHKAHTNSYFPGVEQVDACTIRFAEDSYFEVLRKLKFLL